VSKWTGSNELDLTSNIIICNAGILQSKFSSIEALKYVDVLIVDEAHRLKMKSGMFKNLGENQVMEIIKTAKTSVFFIDEAQKVTWSDVGEISMIEEQAKLAGAIV
jgi:hypothetical protein